MDSLKLCATSSFGLESVVARELQALGVSQTRSENGSVSFEGDALMLCRANLWLRSADRVWLTVGSFPAKTFDELFEGVKGLPWPDLLPQDAVFPVTGACHNSLLSSVPACQGVVKKAVVESLKGRYGVEVFPESGAQFPIRFQLFGDECKVLLDSSGTGLHKRGYRQATAEAPLRETLAAGLVQLSYWNAGRVLFDPFCGSATILIEAAFLGLQRAPGLRRSFACEGWEWVGPEPWREARQEAEDRFDRSTKLQLFGSDISAQALQIAKHNIMRAQMHDRGIALECRAVRDFRPTAEYACLICNPPYGERQLAQDEVAEIYMQLGLALRPTWSSYVLTSSPNLESCLGRKAGRKRKLYNGMLACTYYQYPGPKPPQL
jgi:putative N6-adenine-specific DNA methylase